MNSSVHMLFFSNITLEKNKKGITHHRDDLFEKNTVFFPHPLDVKTDREYVVSILLN